MARRQRPSWLQGWEWPTSADGPERRFRCRLSAPHQCWFQGPGTGGKRWKAWGWFIAFDWEMIDWPLPTARTAPLRTYCRPCAGAGWFCQGRAWGQHLVNHCLFCCAALTFCCPLFRTCVRNNERNDYIECSCLPISADLIEKSIKFGATAKQGKRPEKRTGVKCGRDSGYRHQQSEPHPGGG